MKKILTLLLILLFAIPVLARPYGKIVLIKGKVVIRDADTRDWSKAKIGMVVEDDDVIWLQTKKSLIKIKSKDGKILVFDTVKKYDIAKYARNNTTSLSRLALLKQKLGKTKKNYSCAPTAVAGVRGADINSVSPINPSELIWEE